MRRSKSNPAKYARNYRSISQRQMSQFDDLDEEKEIERLKAVLKNSELTLKLQPNDNDNDNDNSSSSEDDTKNSNNNHNKKKQQAITIKKRKLSNDNNKNHDSDDDFEQAQALLRNSRDNFRPSNEPGGGDCQEDSMVLKPKKGKKRNRNQSAEDKHTQSGDKSQDSEPTRNDEVANLVSDEFLAENQIASVHDVENPLVVLPGKKKPAKKAKVTVELTPYEIKQAKQLQKKTQRKLKQLALRAEQKKKRADLYEKLQKTAIDAEELNLLESSSTLGKRVSKKEMLKKLLQKERASIELTEEERDLLYRDRQVPGGSICSGENEDEDGDGGDNMKDVEPAAGIQVAKQKSKLQSTQAAEEEVDKDQASKAPDSDSPNTNNNQASSFASQMMAALSSLKATSEKQQEENEKKKEKEEEERQRLEQERLQKASEGKSPYVPTSPIIIQTAATNKRLQVHQLPASKRRVLQVARPSEVQEARYDLPVTQMEFEVMDAIRNNDVTIICGETGSGKSTQVPQLIYESGFTLGSSTMLTPQEEANGRSPKYLIGVTQPRRVAAVSTAKRVCYEMGQGDGSNIKSTKRSKGNLVAYQTRYETAGIGENTGLKFMTDGILLQEIQSDLLLRKYSVIVLDECHERNLNCDILCGLIGLALPLRKKASEEPGSEIVPLKLVIMSATLRVDDFTCNPKLFPSTTPYVVKIPGRTFPVTIHHSKLTELDDYEDVAFEKVCKIHRKLPQGGILVFLTGKAEIVRMVNRLRRTLSRQEKSTEPYVIGSRDVVTLRTDIAYANEGGVRDMDDDEVDGDLFQAKDDDDDHDNETEDHGSLSPAKEGERTDEGDDNIPKDVIVLPLYSMLSSEEQAKVFASVPDGHRLVVVSTNIAETSITIPSITYVVDTGREKRKNYDPNTGVASFDISWISKAAASQRAGRAGRTGPGHCYRLYSSSMFSRHMDDFALPEVLTRPLEDVVLAMKAMKITSVSKFPFPTPPSESQVKAAVKLLTNLGCIDSNDGRDPDSDGQVTHLGTAIATLPLGVRCGKMLLVAAHAGVLDYAIAAIAALSEKNPFLRGSDLDNNESTESKEEEVEPSDDESVPKQDEKKATFKWMHKAGDVYAVMLAIGAYTYAGRGAGGISEKVACKQFCADNGLNHVIMERIQKIRGHLSKLVKTRLAGAGGVAADTGKIPHSMNPPNRLQERLLLQVITSSFLDNIAMLAPLGSIPGTHPFSLRSAFLSCSSSIKEPLFMDRNSVLYSRDARRLPQWVCYDYLIRKNLKDGTPIATMKNVTPVDPTWLGTIAKGSNLLSLGVPLPSPRPTYDPDRDEIVCSVETKFGTHKWEIPPIKLPMQQALRVPDNKHSMHFQLDDPYRYFARFLLEGKVLKDLDGLKAFLNDDPSIMTSKTPIGKVGLFVSALANAKVDNASKLRRYWADVDNKFLFKTLKKWVKPEHVQQAKQLWIDTVKKEAKQRG